MSPNISLQLVYNGVEAKMKENAAIITGYLAKVFKNPKVEV